MITNLWIQRAATIVTMIFTTNCFAGGPLISIIPIFKAPEYLASNSFGAAIYQITNNTKTLHSFAMRPIQGVTQVTSTAGACSNPILLGYGQSCFLNLNIMGNQMAEALIGGPIICNNSSQPFACSQPSQSNSLHVSKILGDSQTQNTWISVLVAQDEPPADISMYVQQIIALAPSLQQIHLRVTPGATNYSFYTSLINLLRTSYKTPLLIGYHPDNSDSSYTGWGCTLGDWQCVLNASVKNMNAMNAVADPHQTGVGFNIFSLEQGYVEITPSDPAHFQAVKACLNPAVATSVCPVCSACTPTTVIASPVVTFGNVSQSYGDGIYGSNMLDWGYPQTYNLGKRIAPYDDLITNGYFPTYSTSCHTSPYSIDLYVVDVDSSAAYAPEIPCTATGQTTPNVFTYPDPTTSGPDPTLASAYVGFLMTQYPPISNTIDTHGSTVYMTFSGEPEFLGAPGWSLSLISQFYTDLNANFASLKISTPALFPSGGTDPSALQYAIWNFSSILANE